MDNETLQAELEKAIDDISSSASAIEIIPGQINSSAMILLEEENVNGDNCVVTIAQRADNTAYVSFYNDYYDPDNCTEHFECKDIRSAIKLLASTLVRED